MTRRQALIETLQAAGMLFAATGMLVGCDSGSTETATATQSPERKAEEEKQQQAREAYEKEQKAHPKK